MTQVTLFRRLSVGDCLFAAKLRAGLLVCLCLISATGCMSQHNARLHAAREWGDCPVENLESTRLARRTVGVEGCGHHGVWIKNWNQKSRFTNKRYWFSDDGQ